MVQDTEQIGPEEQSLQPKVFDQLFNQELVNLSIEERKNVAQTYINKFSNTKITEELLREAGVSLETTDPRHIKQALFSDDDPLPVELFTRLNYCKYLLEEKKDVLPYSMLRLVGERTRKYVSTLTPSKDGQFRIIQQPFYFNTEDNLIKQYGEEEHSILLKMHQIMKRAGMIQDTVSDLTNVAVLFFQPPART